MTSRDPERSTRDPNTLRTRNILKTAEDRDSVPEDYQPWGIKWSCDR